MAVLRDTPVRHDAAVQCGFCRLEAFCFRESPAADVGNAPGMTQAACEALGVGHRWIGAAVGVLDREATARRLYCAGPVAVQPDPALSADAPRALEHAPSTCFFNADAWRELAFGGSHADARSLQGSPTCSYVEASCDFSGSATDGLTDWARRLSACPKDSAEQTQTFITSGFRFNLPTEAERNAAARGVNERSLAAYANLFTEARYVNENLGAGSRLADPADTTLPYLCFIRADGVRSSTASRGEPALRNPSAPWDENTNPSVQDPGLDPAGLRLQVAPASSTLTVVKTGGAPQTFGGMTGEAAVLAVPSPSTHFVVTELRAVHPGPIAVDARTFTNMHLALELPWRGTRDAAVSPERIEIPAANVRLGMLAGVTEAGSSQTLGGSIEPDGAVTGTWSGGALPTLTLDGTFRDADSGYTFTLHLVMNATEPRPVATVTSPAGGADPTDPAEVECTGPGGAPFAVSGTHTSGPDAVETFTLRGATTGFAHGPAATFQVPLLPPGSPALELAYGVRDRDMLAVDRRFLRVRDTQAPSAGATRLKSTCGFGHASHEPSIAAPSLCSLITGTWADTCSASRASIVRVRVYDYRTGALVATRELGDGRCITAHPNYVDGELAMADYEVEWRPVDTFGNYPFALRRWRGYFAAGIPTASCTAPVVPVTLSDTSL